MLEHIRGLVTAILSPLVRLLLKLGVSPDAVTVVGTIATCASAMWFTPRGELVAATFAITAFALFDLVDGSMARASNRVSKFGAFLDSTLDRIADAVVFASVAVYFGGPGDSMWGQVMALACLITGALTSYARARAESLGFAARVGLMERADRLVLLGVSALASVWLHQPQILIWGLGLLAVLTSITAIQRIETVRRQANAQAASSQLGPA